MDIFLLSYGQYIAVTFLLTLVSKGDQQISVESTHKVMTQYFSSEHSDTIMMADDVTFTVMPTGQEHHTPEDVLQMPNYFYHVAFNASAEDKNIIIADGQAVWEGDFVGKHIGESFSGCIVRYRWLFSTLTFRNLQNRLRIVRYRDLPP